MADEMLAGAAERVGDRWSLLILAALTDGPMRFSDLTDELEGIAPNTLSSRLSRLESDGLIVARPYQQRPERFAYELTGAGRDLQDVLSALRGWAARRAGGQAPRHELCGTELELRWYCPNCEQPAASPDGDLAYV